MQNSAGYKILKHKQKGYCQSCHADFNSLNSNININSHLGYIESRDICILNPLKVRDDFFNLNQEPQTVLIRLRI